MTALQRLGVAIRRARKRRGWSQAGLARELVAATAGVASLTQSTVSKWERGAHVPSVDFRPALRRLLGGRVGELLDAAESDGTLDEEEHADRRAFLDFLVVPVVGIVGGETAERITAVVGRVGPVDNRLVVAVEDFADTLAGLHYATRSDILVGPAMKYADLLLRLLDRDASQADRQRLEATAVGSCAQAGLLAFQSGDRMEARRFFALARDVADDSGNDTLRSQAFGVTSILHSSMPTGGRGGNTGLAVGRLRRAATYARRADDATRAWVLWWLAPELAAAGDERGFFQAVEAAGRLTGRTEHGDGRGFFARCFGAMTPAQMGGNVGLGLVLLRRVQEAVDALDALMASVPPRWRAVMLTDTAAARLLQSEPEEAAVGLLAALDATLAAGYAMGVERILGVRARFEARCADLAAVRELEERLRVRA